jgi:hypothetical protein
MEKLFRRLALVGLIGMAGLTSTPSFARESITVSRHPWYAVCAGVCPDYEIIVSADGRVIVKQRGTEERFLVSRAEAAEFRAKLQPFRPVGERRDPLVCAHENAPLVMKVREIEIRWSGSNNPSRLFACDNPASAGLKEALRQALWSVHLYVDGRRRD